MNLPNKLTLSRIILSFVIILLLLTPFDAFGIEFPQLFVNELLKVDSKYVIAGVLFVIASLTDMFDGKLEKGSLDVNTGKPSTDDSFNRTVNFIRIYPNKEYRLRANGTVNGRVFYYDENKVDEIINKIYSYYYFIFNCFYIYLYSFTNTQMPLQP